jgi:3-methyladenine DNA glycosylase/8-oxoguanine DNA glycosylase
VTPAAYTTLAKADPVMARLIERHGPCPIIPVKDREPFEALSRAIVYQQLSTKAAATIHARFVGLFRGPAYPTPRQVLRKDDDALRSAGLSRNKTAAMKDLARKTLAGVVPTRAECEEIDDETLIARLTEVRGVGRWTAEMFLIATLARPDVLAIDDLGLRKGAQRAYALAEAPDGKALFTLGERWRPHRTTASWYLWRAVDAPPDALP